MTPARCLKFWDICDIFRHFAPSAGLIPHNTSARQVFPLCLPSADGNFTIAFLTLTVRALGNTQSIKMSGRPTAPRDDASGGAGVRHQRAPIAMALAQQLSTVSANYFPFDLTFPNVNLSITSKLLVNSQKYPYPEPLRSPPPMMLHFIHRIVKLTKHIQTQGDEDYV